MCAHHKVLVTWGEAQVFVYTHTTISGHSWVPPLGQAELRQQDRPCVQKLLGVLTLAQVSCCHCTNTAKQAADRYGRHDSPQGWRRETKLVSLMGLLSRRRKQYKSRGEVGHTDGPVSERICCCCRCLTGHKHEMRRLLIDVCR